MVKSNYYDSLLKSDLKIEISNGSIEVVENSLPIFSQVSKIFPSICNRIDWKQVPRSVQRVEENRNRQIFEFADFFDEMMQKFGLSGNVIYLGDSATDLALVTSMECMKLVIAKIFEIPQHHYLFGCEFSWCMCFMMEGDMGFGFRPDLSS